MIYRWWDWRSRRRPRDWRSGRRPRRPPRSKKGSTSTRAPLRGAMRGRVEDRSSGAQPKQAPILGGRIPPLDKDLFHPGFLAVWILTHTT